MALTTPLRAACLDHTALFQNDLLETPPVPGAGAEVQAKSLRLTARAAQVCGGCPLRENCLYDAVVNRDVAGFVGGTTQAERVELRLRVGITVAPEDFDSLAGVLRSHRQIDHHEVLRLRASHPHESLEVIAHRLGCSLSTVKRHMRKAREEVPAVAPVTVKPTQDQVVAAYEALRRSAARRSETRVA